MKVQHIEHAYECKHCKADSSQSAQIKRGKAPQPAIQRSIAETAKTNGVDFYRYLLKLLTDLPNLDIHRNPEILNQYMPWSKNIQAACGK